MEGSIVASFVVVDKNVAKLWSHLQNYFKQGHRKFLFFISNETGRSNSCQNKLLCRYFNITATLGEVLFYADYNFKIAYPLSIGSREWLASRSKGADLLQPVHANVPAVPTSAVLKTAASRSACVDANTDFWERGQRLCSEHLFIFIKNIFSVSSPGLLEPLTAVKNFNMWKNKYCK